VLGLDDDGIAGHLSAAPRTTRVGDATRRFAEIFGGFVAPRRRRLRRDSDYCRLGRALAEAIATGDDGDFVQFVVPSPVERRLGHAFLEWKPVTTLTVLQRSLDGGDVAGPAVTEATSPRIDVIRFCDDERFARLFERCRGDFAAATVRDAAFLAHRFDAHPGGAFTVLGAVDDAGELRGYAVLRRSRDPASAGTVVLWDWLVPADDVAAGERLLLAAGARARSLGGVALAGFVPEWSPWFDRMQEAGFRVRPTPRFLFARTSSRRHDSHWLHQNWWHTFADTVLEPGLAVPGGARWS
ncbi:MAG: hypothetical protein KDE27_10725, partial [Planctomycetes bacterium]|nr:hypothetical protein [Planctomycetota bacterium]